MTLASAAFILPDVLTAVQDASDAGLRNLLAAGAAFAEVAAGYWCARRADAGIERKLRALVPHVGYVSHDGLPIWLAGRRPRQRAAEVETS